MEMRFLIDVIAKYLVLFAVIFYIGIYIVRGVTSGQTVNMPDWIVMLFTVIIQYFFRKEPRNDSKADKGGPNGVMGKPSDKTTP